MVYLASSVYFNALQSSGNTGNFCDRVKADTHNRSERLNEALFELRIALRAVDMCYSRMELRTDNFADWDKRLFEKQDRSSDASFYALPRKVVHIDEAAVSAVTELYREVLPANGSLLDLMSSWRSHLPSEATYARVAGLGMNAEEMRDNPQLTEFLVQNLNDAPALPYADGEFDGAVCCVSVQYLQQPVAVFGRWGAC